MMSRRRSPVPPSTSAVVSRTSAATTAAVLLTLFPLFPTTSNYDALGAEPASSPAAPATAPAAAADDAERAMRQAFDELADSDAGVREAARVRLMGMERRYLPALQRLVAQRRPVMPSQAAVLRQIVRHVYLAGEPYETVDDAGFLGVRMHETAVSDVPLPAPPVVPVPADGDEPAPLQLPATLPKFGIVIIERVEGFVGNRILLDGDVILGIAERRDVRFDVPEVSDAFGLAVRESGSGRRLHFVVLRRGRLMRVEVTLDARPEAAHRSTRENPEPMNAFDRRRKEKADEYWQSSFGPLLREGVG